MYKRQAVDCAAGNTRPIATIEHVTKLSKDEVVALKSSLEQEWKAVLTMTDCSAEGAGAAPQHSKDPGSGYWSEERRRKVRRLVSEP